MAGSALRSNTDPKKRSPRTRIKNPDPKVTAPEAAAPEAPVETLIQTAAADIKVTVETKPKVARNRRKAAEAEAPKAPEAPPAPEAVTAPETPSAPEPEQTPAQAKALAAIAAARASGVVDTDPPVYILCTLEFARTLLSRNLTNRPFSEATALDYARQYGSDQWEPENYEAIKVTDDGELLDGQHRLNAVLIHGKPVRLLFKFGVPKSVLHTIDTGRKRSISDQLAIAGEVNTLVLAATVRWVLAISNDLVNFKTSVPETMEMLRVNPEIRESVLTTFSRTKVGIPQTLLAAIHFIATKFLDEGERADAFVRVFQHGVPDYQWCAAHKLREKFFEAALRGQGLTQGQKMVDAIYSWNAFRTRKPIQNFRAPTHVTIYGYDPERLGVGLYQRPSLRTVKLEGVNNPIVERVEPVA